jgi:Ca2+ transporting ATPase
MDNAHLLSVDDVLSTLKVDSKRGLSAGQVHERQKKYGKNELPDNEKTPLWKLIIEQVRLGFIF